MVLTKIGVIAGAFDPFHDGHLRFIDESKKSLSLEKVFILIEKRSKHKPEFASYRHRKKIIQLSIGNKPYIELYTPKTDNFPISSTLPHIKTQFLKARFYLLVGSDVKEHIYTWPGSKELLKNVELVVAQRNESDKYRAISSGKVREQIKANQAQIDMNKEALDYCLQHRLYS